VLESVEPIDMDSPKSDEIEFGGIKLSPRWRRGLTVAAVVVLLAAGFTVGVTRRHHVVPPYVAPTSPVAVVIVPTTSAAEAVITFTASYMDSFVAAGRTFSYGISVEYSGSSSLDITGVQAVGRRDFTTLDVRMASIADISAVSDIHHWPIGTPSFHFAAPGEAVVVVHGVFDCSQDPTAIPSAFAFTIGSSTQELQPADPWPQRLFDGICR
jgi:hypothetical protein